MPDTIFRSFMFASVTALNKRDGGVRGIATGTVLRRLVAKTLARQLSAEVEHACSPFHLFSTRVGVDCVGHAVRAVTDADHPATVLSTDGIGAYGHVFRASMLLKLLMVPRDSTRDVPRVDVGRLKCRALPPERTLTRVCRETGAIVRSNFKLRDMNVAVPVEDEPCVGTCDAPWGPIGGGHHPPQRHFFRLFPSMPLRGELDRIQNKFCIIPSPEFGTGLTRRVESRRAW